MVEKISTSHNIGFSSERSEEGVKEALFARRTAILFNGVLAGKEDILRRLFLASVHLRMIENNSGYTELCNTSDLNYILLINNFQYNLPANKLYVCSCRKKENNSWKLLYGQGLQIGD